MRAGSKDFVYVVIHVGVVYPRVGRSVVPRMGPVIHRVGSIF